MLETRFLLCSAWLDLAAESQTRVLLTCEMSVSALKTGRSDELEVEVDGCMIIVMGGHPALSIGGHHRVQHLMVIPITKVNRIRGRQRLHSMMIVLVSITPLRRSSGLVANVGRVHDLVSFSSPSRFLTQELIQLPRI